MRLYLRLFKDGAEILQKILGAQFERRGVHRHGNRRQARLKPGSGLSAGFAQHPAANRSDQATVLGDGNELPWRQQSALRMLPADERLGANNSAA